MEPTSRGFFEVRDVFFRELVEMSKNLLNGGSKEKLGEVRETVPGNLIQLDFILGPLDRKSITLQHGAKLIIFFFHATVICQKLKFLFY